jgi:SAM-dependent methyltransferase
MTCEFSQPAPNAARIYDYLLGGSASYDADRQAAKMLLRAVPEARRAARDNRAFLGRAVRYLAGTEDISQFLDIGAGLPTTSPAHQLARQVRPDARVVYADHDPVVIAYARALLAGGPPGQPPPGAAVLADLRDPEKLLDAPEVRDVIDFSRPAAVLLIAVLHFIPDSADPAGIMTEIISRLAPGSCVVISHATADFLTPEAALTARAAYAGASVPAVPRTRDQVAAFFDGLAMIPPGLSDINGWRPALAGYEPGRVLFWAGAGRVRP